MNVKSENIANSSWIDPDEAPELSEEDFAKGQWFKGDIPINAQEGKDFFCQMMTNSINTPLEYDIVKYFKAKSNEDGYINLINRILRLVIEQEQNINSHIS